ncbi:unnamed protein product, partial [Allacma fusca]
NCWYIPTKFGVTLRWD